MIVSFGVVLAEIREVVSGSWVFILVWIILIVPPWGWRQRKEVIGIIYRKIARIA